MDNLEVIARFKVRPGQLDGLKAQAAEVLRLTREHDTHTLRCDFFLNADGTECEVHELFPNEQGLIEHKMNTMEPTTVMFRDFASDHHSTLFGDVSDDFVKLVTERMGPPTVFTFVEGLASTAPMSGGVADHLEVVAHMNVRPGQVDGVKAQMAELARLTREKDTRTLRYDVFLDESGTECEVHEAYIDEAGLLEHSEHVGAARNVLFRDFATDHRMSVYGPISPHLDELFTKHAGGVHKFSFVEGLEAKATV